MDQVLQNIRKSVDARPPVTIISDPRRVGPSRAVKRHSIPPHLYAKVLSKKHGRMDDLSVVSFADLSMYQTGSPMEDVVRQKQPVFYGPPNQRGRRKGYKNKLLWEEHAKIPYSISMPVGFIPNFVSSVKNPALPVATSVRFPSKTLADASLDLNKFRKVPHGVGLREQMMGDYVARPVKHRGRPRKNETAAADDFAIGTDAEAPGDIAGQEQGDSATVI